MDSHEEQQLYALTTLLPLIIFDVEEVQRLTASLEGHRGTRLIKQTNMDLPLRALHIDQLMRARWQVDVVERALEDLCYTSRTMGLAVWYEYVSQWQEYESERRQELAMDGLRWMLDRIQVELIPYSPEYTNRTRGKRDNKIRELRATGWTIKRISVLYRITPRRVRQILKMEVAHETGK